MDRAQIEAYFDDPKRQEQLVQAISRLVRIRSVREDAQPGMPFGPGPAAALAERGVTAWLSPAGDGVWSGPSLSIRFYSPGAASRSSILLLSCRGYDTDGELVAFCD